MKVVLATNLEKIAALLDEAGDRHWSAWLRQDAADLRDGDMRGAHHFLSAFGGMGSIGDRYYCSPAKKDNKSLSADERIGRELDDAWNLARAIVGHR